MLACRCPCTRGRRPTRRRVSVGSRLLVAQARKRATRRSHFAHVVTVPHANGLKPGHRRRAKRRPEDVSPEQEQQEQGSREFPRVTPLPPRELGPGRDRPLYNDTADAVRQDPRLRDPELDEFAARELLEFDRQLKERKGQGQGKGKGQQRGGRGPEGQERGQAAGDRHKESK